MSEIAYKKHHCFVRLSGCLFVYPATDREIQQILSQLHFRMYKSCVTI